MELTQRQRVEKFLAKNYKGKFIISDAPNANEKYEVSSRGNVTVIQDIERLVTDDFIFTKVRNFNCRGKYNLKSLKDAPQEVEEFYCGSCSSLQSLEGAPQKVKVFSSSGCSSLQSLEGAPKEVDEFYCNFCYSLQSLQGAPRKTEIFGCANCDSLQSLDEMPVCNILVCDKRFKNSIPAKRIKKEVRFEK